MPFPNMTQVSRTRFQVFKTAVPSTNNETGEICEDVICIKCNSKTNEETGELEKAERSTFKVSFHKPPAIRSDARRVELMKCEKCKRGRHSLTFLIVTLTMVIPSLGAFLYLMAESLLHQYAHSHKKDSFKSKMHCVFSSWFCAFCQAERSMNLIGKLQDERLAKMRKYVKTIPIQ